MSFYKLEHLLILSLYCLFYIESTPETWSGGWAGVTLNGSELDIYSVVSSTGGVFTHFWITGGNKTWIDNAIVSYYIDNESTPSVQFQVNLAGGTGFVDDTTTCTLGNCAEKNSNWGNKYIGKGSGMGGWYNNIKIPFMKSFRATIKSYLDCITNTKYSIMRGFDFYGNDIENGQYLNITNINDCYNLCINNKQCKYFTFRGDENECFLKSSYSGIISSIPSVESGDIDRSLCTLYHPQDSSMFTLVRGVYDRSSININIGDFTLPLNTQLITQSFVSKSTLQPLEYYNIFEINNSNGGLLFMSTLSIVSENLNFLEGCFHFYNSKNQIFPGEIVATGTEDYYDSGYYFIDAYPQHLPQTGFTWYETFKNNYGPFLNGLKWSAYRLHYMDLMSFKNNSKLVWRNGDVADNGIGKCRHQGNGTPVGNPSQSFVRSLAFIYIW
eukprot:218570_1